MNQRWFMFSRSVAYKWIVSYSVIMLIPLIVSAIIYTQTKQIVEYEIQRAGRAMLKQVQYMVDGEISQAEKLAMQLSIHPDVNKYMNLTPGEEKNESFQIYQARQELSKYKSANDFINGIYLYSNSLGRVLTDETYSDSQTFYSMNGQWIGMSYAKWMDILNGGPERLRELRPFIEFQRWGANVVLLKLLPNATAGETPRGTVIIPLNGSKVQSMLKNVDWVNNGDVYIVDQNNQILFQNNQMDSLVPLSFINAEDKPTGTAILTISGTENIVTYVTSDTTEWRYVSVFPSSVFWEKAREIRKLNLFGLLLCFLIGGGVIYYFARKHYNPVRELVEVFSFSDETQTRLMLDEFSFIRESALATIRERDDMNSRQFKQLRVLQTYYLSRLLKGQAEEGLSVEEAARLYHFDWKSDDFAVLLFYIEAQEERSPSTSLSNFIVSNIIMDFAGNLHSLSFTEADGMLAAVINIRPERLGGWKEDMEEALANTREFIERKYRLQIVMAGSERHSGLGSLHQACLQALEAQEYRLVLQENVSIWYGDIEPAKTEHYLSINDEVVFMNLIKSGDLQQATAMADDILAQFFASQSPIELVRCAMIDLASSIMKSIPPEARESLMREEWRPMKRLLACTARGEFRQELIEMLTLACSKVNEKLSLISNAGIGEEVAGFVRDNYADINLSVSLIGARFGITPQYVSRLFKEQTGQGLHDFIGQVRTGEAKLLLQQGVTIEEIASRVGFSSSSAFIRVFKKYEGITPGRYKNLQ